MNGEEQKTILLVEDDFIIASAEIRSLKQFGYKVLFASSGEEAVRVTRPPKTVHLQYRGYV